MRVMTTRVRMDVEEYLRTGFDGSEYLSIGVERVWVIDPEEKSALSYSRQNPAGGPCDTLRTENPAFEIPLARAFDLNA